MEIREYAELSARQRALAAGVEHSDAEPPSTMTRLDRVRIGGRRLLDYRSLYAVERGVPLARVGSTRPRFRFADGSEETVAGVADVLTRADAVRRGYATRLLRAVHRAAESEGIGWALLWTRRSWGAHRAYERLGYRDVYAYPLATRPPRRAPRRRGSWLTVRTARRTDARLLERLLASAASGRVGFAVRPPGWFDAMFRLGWRSPTTYRILYRDRRPLGYVHAAVDRFDVVSREVAVPGPAFYRAALDYLETLAGGRWLGLASTTFLRDAAGEIERRRYDRVPLGHGVMMARRLGPDSRDAWAELRRTIDDPRFWLQGGDMI
jgi:GNAT superfamily N-acetyltransferase